MTNWGFRLAGRRWSQTAIERYLLELNSRGQYVAVFLDEAEGLDTYMLDLVRTLLNYEKSDTGKLIQFVMAGALDIHERLARKRNRAIRSRVLYMNYGVFGTRRRS